MPARIRIENLPLIQDVPTEAAGKLVGGIKRAKTSGPAGKPKPKPPRKK